MQKVGDIDSKLSLSVISDGFLVPFSFSLLLGFVCSKIQQYTKLQIKNQTHKIVTTWLRGLLLTYSQSTSGSSQITALHLQPIKVQ